MLVGIMITRDANVSSAQISFDTKRRCLVFFCCFFLAQTDFYHICITNHNNSTYQNVKTQMIDIAKIVIKECQRTQTENEY